MSAVIEHSLDLKSVRSAWQRLNKLVPLGPIVSDKEFQRRVRIMDELLDRVGANESHPLMPLLDLVSKSIEAYEMQHHALSEAAPGEVLSYLIAEHDLKQTDLAEELGGQSVVSAILNGKRELNARQIKALAKRFNVSPAVFI